MHYKILRQAIKEIEVGQYEACLGGYLYKKRIAISNKGKRGGLRAIIAFKKEYEVKDRNNEIPQFGWKLHLAVEDSIPGNLEKAWNTIKDILVEYRVGMSKMLRVIDPTLSRDHAQYGKQITIYYKQSLEQKIIPQIETALRSNEISPDKHSLEDRTIPGSRYFSYRNDNYPKDYVDAEGAGEGIRPKLARELTAKGGKYEGSPVYNVANGPDPLEKITLSQQEDGSVSLTNYFFSSLSGILNEFHKLIE